MFLTEWNQEEALAHEREEGREEGRAEGIAIGEQRIRSIYEWISKSGRFSQEELADMMANNDNVAYGLQ